MNLTATDAAQLCGLSVRSVNALYQRMRVRLARQCAAQFPFSGELEVDESSFGPKRIRGKRGCGAGDKTIVFALLKQGDCVYTEIVADASKATLQAIIRGKVDPNSISTPTAGEAATGWLIWVWASPFGSITAATNSSRAADTSTASSLFGAMSNIGWRSFMTCDVASSRCISRTLSCVSITAILISTRHCLDCSGTSLCEAFAS